ncbi:TetR/AcrR family transcriptional regulator [Rubellimicrobium rubrum]|nr:TetR/AcrR family transcriptional regulator [Rubellimicrobium rubrum]
MRDRLLAAARPLFVAHGFAGTSTPAIVAAAGVTRGALYHHFEDKAALLRAILEREAQAIAVAIEEVDQPEMTPVQRLLAGAEAYLAAMSVEGRADLLLVQGPAVLGSEEVRRIEAGHGEASLRAGLEEAVAAGALPDLPIEALASILSAMFERAALDVEAGAKAVDLLATLRAVLVGLFHSHPRGQVGRRIP